MKYILSIPVSVCPIYFNIFDRWVLIARVLTPTLRSIILTDGRRKQIYPMKFQMEFVIFTIIECLSHIRYISESLIDGVDILTPAG